MRMLGKLEPKVDERNLMAARYMGTAVAPPETYDFMNGRGSLVTGRRRKYGTRKPLPARTFGNNQYGDCTKASQANALMRLERLEQRRTVVIPDAEVIAQYLAMTGGADEGWYELDAIKNWRTVGFDTPSTKDEPGNRYKIDAFAQVNVDRTELMRAMSTFHLIKICFALPKAWQHIEPEGYGTASGNHVWDVGVGPDYDYGGWGGHSMMADAYDQAGLWVVHTWYEAPKQVRQYVTWEAVLKYSDEAYTIVDSLNAFKKRAPDVMWAALEADLAKAITD